MTVAQWLDLWYDTYVARSRELAPSTKACYRRAVNAVPPWLADAPLDEPLLSLQLCRWLSDVAEKHPRAAQLDHCMLSMALRTAGKLDLCSHASWDKDLVPKPYNRPKQALIFDAAQCRVYIRAAHASDVYPLLMLCLCGLRRGEALGTRWQDLHGDTLQLMRQRQRIGGEYATRALKSEKSCRSLVLPSWLLAELETWPRTLAGWIVDTTPEHLHREHRGIIQAEQLPAVTLHGLRHTFATLAASQGIDMKHLQVALGHSKMALTSDLYADHLSPLSALPSLVWQAF